MQLFLRKFMRLPVFLSLHANLYVELNKNQSYDVVNKKTVPLRDGKDHIMKAKSSNRTVYVITAVLSVFVLLLAAAGFTNVEAQKVNRISADNNLIKHADAAGELAASMGVANTVYPMSEQEAETDGDSELGRMAEALKPVAEFNSDASTLDRDVAYLLNNGAAYGATYGEICTAASASYRADLDAANHDAAVWTAVCAVLALAGIAGLVVSVTKIEYNEH